MFAAERILSKELEGATSVLEQGEAWAKVTGRRLSMVDKMLFEAGVVLAKRQALELHEKLRLPDPLS